MAALPNPHVVLIAVVSALGGFVYGVDSGIIATTMGHDSFKLYMYGPSMTDASIQGAIVSLYNAGQSLGTVASSWSADRFSRRYTIMAAGLLATLGAALQTAAVHVGMMVAGRFVAGLACGMILATVPVYIAEISPHEHRGLMVGMQGMMIAVGFAAANWIGYGGAFAESGAAVVARPPSGQHLAAVLHDKGSALAVEHRQTPAPGPTELLVEVKSVALNPIDWKQRASGFHIAGYPTVLGSDVAGVVLSAGPAVPADAPKPGSRIAAFASAFFTEGDPNYGALQTRVIIPAANAVPLPETTSFDEGALLPMAVATAWSGWYSIGIPRDTAHTPADKKGFLVWGGASSVGGAAIQLATSMGFSVYATASERHHEYLKTLGAKRLFDYRGENVPGSIVKAVQADGVHLQLAFDAVGALQSCQEILRELNPNATAKLASATPLLPDSPKMNGVETKFVLAPTDGEKLTEFFHFVFGVWLREKLATGEYIPSPGIKVIEGGLDSANKALDELQGGVSGTKLVLHI